MICPVFGWFVPGMRVVWLVCGWCLGSLAGLWVICEWFGCFVGDFEFYS